MLRSIITLMFVLYQTCSWAGELGLIVNGKSVHLQKKEGETYNEDNWGTGIEYRFDQSPSGWKPFVQVSGFVDSNYNNSYYVGGGYLYRVDTLSTQNDGFTTSLGVFGFVMYREREDGHNLFPGAVPVLSLGTKYLSVNVTYAPKYVPNTGPLFFMQAVIPLGDI